MPRGFGKSRWELTVKDSTRRKIAAQEGVDENLEVTRRAGRLLDQFGEYGVVFNYEHAVNHLRTQERLKNYDELLTICKKLVQPIRDSADIFKEVDCFVEELINRTRELVREYEELRSEKISMEVLAEIYREQRDEKEREASRYKALLDEHCQGCPASELK